VQKSDFINRESDYLDKKAISCYDDLMETLMPKRITVLLEDDLYDTLLARAGSTHKISQSLNPLLRKALAQEEAAQATEQNTILTRINTLEQELAQLKAEVRKQE
jgi:hypothetical protein